MKRILSGINPSSSKGLHLGNYLGAVKSHVEYQSKGECFYFIANLHSLNTVFNKQEVMDNTMNIFTEYLAFGIDPSKTTFYVESDISEIPYLQTILNNVVTVSELKRMHAYKDKMQNAVDHDAISMGLFSYPVLMAADILIFDADVVPVGEDQSQHVEICREMARTFNNRYGNVLKIPELSIKKETARVIGIDGERKMSKSLGNDLPVFADEKIIRQQIMNITTDPARIHPTDPGNPAKNVAFTYFELLGHDFNKVEDMKERYKKGTIGDVEIKKTLFDVYMAYFADIRARKEELMQDRDYIHELRIEGAKKAQEIASKTVMRIKKAVGVA
ncbi:MAG TPA: tryptophan--tRNA ligase [Candidatus Woesebacteria bacterium]|nr:tryptophan--tRNA ligase [Candidatus Woesebacteria bacterium]